MALHHNPTDSHSSMPPKAKKRKPATPKQPVDVEHIPVSIAISSSSSSSSTSTSSCSSTIKPHDFSYLPDELAIQIGHFLDTRSIILGYRLVNRHYNAVTRIPLLWKYSSYVFRIDGEFADELNEETLETFIQIPVTSVRYLQHAAIIECTPDDYINEYDEEDDAPPPPVPSNPDVPLAVRHNIITRCCTHMKSLVLRVNSMNDEVVSSISAVGSTLTRLSLITESRNDLSIPWTEDVSTTALCNLLKTLPKLEHLSTDVCIDLSPDMNNEIDEMRLGCSNTSTV
jgi:hypothetical protein